MDVPVNQLDNDDGVVTLIAKLDGVFLKEEKYRAEEQ